MGRKRSEVPNKESLCSLCSHLYYCQDLSQEEIAKRLGVTKSYISKILDAARKSGIFKVHVDIKPLEKLSARLIGRYQLRTAVIVQVDKRTWEDREFDLVSPLREMLGEAAAKYLESREGPLKDSSRIGVSCGKTPLASILPLKPGIFQKLTITPLTVESVPELAYQAPSTLIGLLQAKYPKGTKAYGPQLIPSKGRFRQRTYRDIKKRVEQGAKDLDLALVGIGVVDLKNPQNGYTQIISEAGALSSVLKDAVGEINNRPYDKDGNDLFEKHPNLGKHIIAVSLDQLRVLSRDKRRCIMAVAGGKAKLEAIRVALETQIVNTLITDSLTAADLLKDNSNR